MQPVPRIFVSATSRDLRTARGLVSEGLRRMECLPIVQDDFPPDYKSVREMLRTKLETCDAVVHLAGFYYGAEPQPVLEGPDRRSFTQMEYEMAVELGLPCYVFLCGENFPFDEHEPEPEEKRALQLAHRARLLEREELYYEFDSREDLNSRTRELQLSVESLREELAKERTRRRMTLVVAAAALIVAVGGGLYLFSKTQSQEAVIAETVEKLDAQSALITQLLEEQARLRESIGGGGADIAAQAAINVAKANNQSPEEIRAAIEAVVQDAEAAVQGATDPAAQADALLQLAEAQMAAGRSMEAIAALRERRDLLDREDFPLEWASTTAQLAQLLARGDANPWEPQELLVEGIGWATANPELGPEHPATLTLMLARAELPTTPPEQRVSLSGQVLAIRDRDLGPQDPQSVDAAWVLAVANSAAGNFATADPLFTRVIDQLSDLNGPADGRTLNARWTRARALADAGDTAKAEELLRENIAISAEANGEGDEATLEAKLGLAMFLEEFGEAADATACYRELLADAEKALGPENPFTISLMGSLAVRLRNDGNDLAGAEELSRRQVDLLIRTVGPDQPSVLEAMNGLAQALDAQGRTEEYREVMQNRIATGIRLYGEDSLVVAQDQYLLAVDYLAKGEAREAVPLLEKSHATRSEHLGSAREETLQSLNVLNLALFQIKDWEAVLRGNAEALAAYESMQEPPADKVNETLNNLTRAAYQTGDWEAVDRHGRRALAMAESLFQPDEETILLLSFWLAVGQEKLGNAEDALVFARRVEELAPENIPPDHWINEDTQALIQRLDSAQ